MFRFSENPILKWTPTLLMMLVIFLFSARPSTDLHRDWWDPLIYKGGHVIGYAMLTLAFWRAFAFRPDRNGLLWLLVITYAMTDEFHQSFVPGRHPSAFDIFVYDNIGSLLALWLSGFLRKLKQPIHAGRVVETETLPANA